MARAGHRAWQIGVVVPAHNEQVLLPDCLASVGRSASGLDVRVVVVLDGCTDATPEVCRRAGVETVTVSARNVGAARAAGVDRLLEGRRKDRLWLAHTDADSQVGPTWLTDQLDLAGHGADAVLGVVRLAPNVDGRYARHQSAYRRRLRRDGGHDHVHGANMGLTASAYVAAGGFPPLAAHEDRHLVHRLDALPDITVVRSSRLWVETSPRLEGRCREGFAADLAASLPA